MFMRYLQVQICIDSFKTNLILFFFSHKSLTVFKLCRLGFFPVADVF